MVKIMNHEYVLPLIDISLLNSDYLEDRMQVVQALDRACKEVGFLYIQGEQFQPELFDKLKEIAESYFAQDENQKMQNYIGLSKNHSGYVPIGEEQFKANVYDLKEAYDINYDYQEIENRRPLLGPTQWPNDPQFKEQVLAYYQHIKAIGHQLFKAFALALELEEDYFDAHLKHAPSQLRLIHYPFNPNAEDQFGIGAHTDYECFTLLFPTAEGLQVLDKQGEWIDIPLIENTMVMNIGDMMEILSNGRYLATKHRVKRVKQERYSFPLFFSCNYDYIIQPIIKNEDPHYPPMKGGEHLFNQTAQTFRYLKQRIASGELVLENARPLYSFGLNEQGEVS
ncbi:MULTISPECIES: isopenicillin N synthase family oxygenase [Acinetobacter]|jgi:isopenicillin N synthase-like dioxygenase|uniref:isopenicillin N synthase family dioxygenase n=1 Tax=Acinetobacter TaxID=469 RepID=UPI000C471216|nr:MULTISPECIES: 2-oxoglutarate and iron-dependent oxygenase domain-containing protein [Acinetobacter]MEC8566916.1 2-oxoglutarate and iron-dependent oxygenase domain-containing protein [Pseudomonadota bacterium]MBC69549.1 2OG-Fe(II) oxygenase [Acinetobacter sp.]MBT49263.1 2OG-Fe(II) oxygenase [Acinetobacter sp.]HIQ35919.1 isopenicillin N synthase family oxygenase [Acinetobacter venetianus]HJP48030.1 2-oxoglutarate and iron-dependent oxygenase domain-containing protein [Acinetobacter venetianus|tara:strand:- start:1010 stop:2026 length:1017 start_codon:yes stop_codon:yes gene_type:complete